MQEFKTITLIDHRRHCDDCLPCVTLIFCAVSFFDMAKYENANKTASRIHQFRCSQCDKR